MYIFSILSILKKIILPQNLKKNLFDDDRPKLLKINTIRKNYEEAQKFCERKIGTKEEYKIFQLENFYFESIKKLICFLVPGK